MKRASKLKQIVMVLVCGLLLVSMGLLTIGCEGTGASDWTFKNATPWDLVIAPNGQNWTPVFLTPGSSAQVDYNGDNIQYLTPSNVHTEQDGRTITLYPN